MPITILTGLPGAGKSETLITRINSARREGRAALTFMCSESPVLRARHNLTELRQMRCRSGLHTRLDHFVSTERAIEMIARATPGALLGFDEALHFGDGLVAPWCEAAARGVDMLIASPSPSQIEALESRGHAATRLRLSCQRCREREASHFFLYLEDNRTESVCEVCHQRLRSDAERQVRNLLLNGGPRPGEQWLAQPVELPAFSNWNLVRNDCRQRLRLIIDCCAREGLPGAHSTYLDFGCGTGFFCCGMARAGFNATGLDPAPGDIEVARLLSTYIRRDAAAYRQFDPRGFLHLDNGSGYDVVTAFGISEWKQWGDDPRLGRDCLRKLFRETKRICIIEEPFPDGPGTAMSTGTDRPAGNGNSAPSKHSAFASIDGATLPDLMQAEGSFQRIERVDRNQYNLEHDLAIGYRN